jgi:hypothetical protein
MIESEGTADSIVDTEININNRKMPSNPALLIDGGKNKFSEKKNLQEWGRISCAQRFC